MKKRIIKVMILIIIFLFCIILALIYEKNKKKDDQTKVNVSIQNQESIKIMFFGDLMFDRGVKYYIKDKKARNGYLSGFYDYIQHITSGNKIDFFGFNLESPIVENKNQCKKLDKAIAFCSEDFFMKELQNIGFNMANIANNHAYDNRRAGIKKTREILTKRSVNFFGGFDSYGITGENTIYSGTFNGKKIAWIGIDTTVSNKGISGYYELISGLTISGYDCFVSIHRGDEYKLYHNIHQENIAKNLIANGAKIIIGHHSHVIQDIQRYDNVPVIYSLGNFLFDQGFSEDTKKGMYVYITYYGSGKIELSTGMINTYAKNGSIFYK